MRFAIAAQLEVEEIDHRGTKWSGSFGLPTFYVESHSPESAHITAMDIIGRNRPNVVAVHFTPVPV